MKYIFSRKRGGGVYGEWGSEGVGEWGSGKWGVGSGEWGNGTALRLPKDLGSYSHIQLTLYEKCLSGK